MVLAEEEFYEHAGGKIFLVACKELGIDLRLWEYGEGEVDSEPQNYGVEEDPYRIGEVYFSNAQMEDHSLSYSFVERKDIDGKWHLERLEITQD